MAKAGSAAAVTARRTVRIRMVCSKAVVSRYRRATLPTYLPARLRIVHRPAIIVPPSFRGVGSLGNRGGRMGADPDPDRRSRVGADFVQPVGEPVDPIMFSGFAGPPQGYRERRDADHAEILGG